MRWSTYSSPADGSPRVGIETGEGTINGLEPGLSLIDVLRGEGLAYAADRARATPTEVVAVGAVRLLAPIPQPPSVRDFMSFEGHLRTAAGAMGVEVPAVWYESPAFYFSNPASILGPVDPVRVAPGSQAFDFELEVAAVVGVECADVDPIEAEACIAGFTVMCDWSARDLQRQEMPLQMGPSKGKDTATSLGGSLVTPDEIADLRSEKGYDLKMSASVNDVPYSLGNLTDLWWSFGEMLAHASRGTRLVPGDVIGSGTVGTGCILELAALYGPANFPYLRPGDRVRLEVERLGAIDSLVVGFE